MIRLWGEEVEQIDVGTVEGLEEGEEEVACNEETTPTGVFGRSGGGTGVSLRKSGSGGLVALFTPWD